MTFQLKIVKVIDVLLIWRITQVWLKGTVLKTVRWVKPRKSSNLLFSFDAGVAELADALDSKSSVR